MAVKNDNGPFRNLTSCVTKSQKKTAKSTVWTGIVVTSTGEEEIVRLVYDVSQ